MILSPVRIATTLLACCGLAASATPAAAQLPGGLTTTPNDLFALGQGGGDTPTKAAVAHMPEPPFQATPRAQCGPGAHPEPGIQGRVPAGANASALNCNVTAISHQGSSGGFKTFRYIDGQGQECAYYDTALLFPTNAFNGGLSSTGVAVLDMSDPAHPKQTATLSSPSMLTPHESLNLNVKRGLLAAVSGNPSTYPGVVSIYDVHNDCLHPVLDSVSPVARLGHESGFSLDGRTFYATGTAYQAITAIDITDPTQPHAIWQGNILSHGMSLSDDGNRAYIADATGGDMMILDTSQIQARAANPQTKEISRLTWTPASIPQNAIPFTENGHPYVLEFDEYTQQTLNSGGNPDGVGAGRIIDIADEAKPIVIANLRLQVNQPADHHAASGDPGALSPVQGYAAHYCNIPTRTDPKIVACSFITSGLRLFDISSLTAPKEIGYYVAAASPQIENGYMGSNYAMSQPTIVPERREVWYTDGATGFYVLRVPAGVWPQGGGASVVSSGGGAGGSGGSSGKGGNSCVRLGRVTFKLHRTRFGSIRKVRAFIGKRLVLSRKGRNLRSITLRVSAGKRVRIQAYDRHGLARTSVRMIKKCSKTKPHTRSRAKRKKRKH